MSSLPWRPRSPVGGGAHASASASTSADSPIAPTSVSSHSSDTVSDVNRRQRHSRTSTPKVRTGCATCKKRHVKCDETKPYCMNCLKTRGFCEGYVIKPRKKRAKPVPKERGIQTFQVTLAAPPTAGTRLAGPNLNAVDFSDNLDMMYFDEFVRFLNMSLGSAATYSKLWKVTVPQLARTNETLRHAAVAIGALSRASNYGNFSTLPESPAARQAAIWRMREESPHFHNAIVHYCRALRLQSQAILDASVMQNAIILSVLFICFEVIRGDRRSAIEHINHGLALIFSILTDEHSQSRIATLAPNPQALLADVVDTYINLAMQCRSVLTGRVGGGVPLSALSKELTDKGQSIDMFLTVLAQVPRQQGIVDLDAIPPVFRSTDEAEQYCMAIQHRAMDVGPVIIELMQQSRILEIEDDAEIDRILDGLFCDERVVAINAQALGYIHAWEAAFQPLYDAIIGDVDAADRELYVRALYLRLQYLVYRSFSSIVNYVDAEIMMSLSSSCREINSLAEHMLRTTQREFTSPAHHVSLDSGVTWFLSLVTIFCRDPLVREDAIRILSEYPRRNGLWDSRTFKVVAERNRGIERVNSVAGTRTEQWRRLWRREYVFEDAGNRILFRFMDRDLSAPTGWRLVEEVCDLPEDPDAEVVWRRQPLAGEGKFVVGNLIQSFHPPEESGRGEAATSDSRSSADTSAYDVWP